MGKARILGQFKPYTPNSRAVGKYNRKAPWNGTQPKKIPVANIAKKESEK